MASLDDMPPGWAEENKGPLILKVTTSVTAIALLFTVARIYSRFLSIKRIAIDDILVVCCIVLGVSYVAVSAVAIQYGSGRHVMTLSDEDVSNAVYYSVVSFVPGVLSFVVPKFAVIILLAKILGPSPLHVRAMWLVSGLYGSLAFGMLVINFVQCTPAAAQWGGAPGSCWDRTITVDYALALGVVSAVFDFYLAIYPTVVLCRLQMHWQKKLALASSLGFGYCAGAITIYKCTTLPGLLHIKDFTYAVDDVIIWTNVEGNCILIGACIPTLYPLVRRIFGSSALGGIAPKEENKGTDSNNPPTIGSDPKKRKPVKSTLRYDTTDELESKFVVEERPIIINTSAAHDIEATPSETALTTKESRW
ncbi:hypothetical protein B0H63DRAFT_167655 [Podospora didyma]|uniref:Rhodopsin domain-containing protein n=1 Tax=Podospora didyma TaxID=330526 RepID=A0AAE0U298_9PEZI|nr:hypothetical protein B0H63DRAFT_167655 [Podospora didyma]